MDPTLYFSRGLFVANNVRPSLHLQQAVLLGNDSVAKNRCTVCPGTKILLNTSKYFVWRVHDTVYHPPHDKSMDEQRLDDDTSILACSAKLSTKTLEMLLQLWHTLATLRAVKVGKTVEQEEGRQRKQTV